MPALIVAFLRIFTSFTLHPLIRKSGSDFFCDDPPRNALFHIPYFIIQLAFFNGLTLLSKTAIQHFHQILHFKLTILLNQPQNLCAVQQIMITEIGADPDDIYMSTLKAAQLSEKDFSGSAIGRDLMDDILSSICEAHTNDSTAADTTGVNIMKEALETATHFEGSEEEKSVSAFMYPLGIKYRKSPRINSLSSC